MLGQCWIIHTCLCHHVYSLNANPPPQPLICQEYFRGGGGLVRRLFFVFGFSRNSNIEHIATGWVMKCHGARFTLIACLFLPPMLPASDPLNSATTSSQRGVWTTLRPPPLRWHSWSRVDTGWSSAPRVDATPFSHRCNATMAKRAAGHIRHCSWRRAIHSHSVPHCGVRSSLSLS
jgi:hypothetical protein